MIGRLHHVIIDCPDPGALADFYSTLLGKPVTYRSDDFCVVSDNEATSGVAFQRVETYLPPQWPDPAHPQQLHFDVMVEDVDRAHDAVVALGATPLSGGDHVYADPAGHPFCLVPRPGWAEPIPS
jgi:catechol 2,3-dioxygenase-like lactoylglutathione lyase family enzyme